MCERNELSLKLFHTGIFNEIPLKNRERYPFVGGIWIQISIPKREYCQGIHAGFEKLVSTLYLGHRFKWDNFWLIFYQNGGLKLGWHGLNFPLWMKKFVKWFACQKVIAFWNVPSFLKLFWGCYCFNLGMDDGGEIIKSCFGEIWKERLKLPPTFQ